MCNNIGIIDSTKVYKWNKSIESTKIYDIINDRQIKTQLKIY